MFDRLIHRPHQRRMIWATVLVGIIAVLFWTQSRYPSLDEKAMMSGAIQLEDPLSFEALLPLLPDHSVVERIVITTLNWMKTNRNGMTFGVLFAAAFLTMLGYLRRRSFQGPFANAFYGLALGAPLGVCVNCAAPIAKGLYTGGSRAETTLAAMVASPTLNIVVLTMAFSLLPFYIAVTKLVLSLGVILLAVPILCRFIPPERLSAEVPDPHDVPAAPLPEEAPPTESFGRSILEFGKDFGGNLWFIVSRTVPLMLLAGFLGAVVATFFPVDSISGENFGPLGLVFAALVGTFLPVPIGFDVVVSGALLNGGMGHGYIMTLVFTLGSFSIYSLFIVATSIGMRAAFMLGGTIMLTGLVAGAGAQAWHGYQTQRALDILTAAEEAVIPRAEAAAMPATPLDEAAGRSASGGGEPTVTVSATPFNPRSPEGDAPFTRIEAWRLGVDKPVEFSFADMWPPFWEGRSVTSGDIDRDGDLDLVFASTEAGLYAYANDGDGRFTPIELDLGAVADLPVFNAALVDLDDDGWLDLFVATYREGMFVIPNREGELDPSSRRPVENSDDALLALSLSFADIEGDGDLDAALGNWAAGWYRRIPGEESRNRILLNESGRLTGARHADLPGIPGETLSILFSDMDQDGAVDLLVGNDFEVPDYFYFGDGDGGFDPVTRQDGRIEHTTTTTMALKTADLDNDLDFEIYAAQIAGRSSGVSDRLRMRPIARYCEGIERESDRETCQRNIDIKRWYRAGHSFDPAYADRCQQMEGRYRDECRAMLVKDLAIQNRDPSICGMIPAGQLRVRQLCDIHFQPPRPVTDEEEDAAISQILGRNVLLVEGRDGAYSDEAEARGVEVGGWSWDVKIADFDNDGWQDIYIVNGTWVPNEVTPSNIFLSNDGTGRFSEETERFGLTDFLMTAAAITADLDNDGDLDLVTVPVNAPTIAYINNSQDGHAIAFRLEDEIGNHYGVGARIEIETASGRQVREIQSGGGFMSFDAPVAHFGLGEDEVVDEVVVHWPDGGSTVIDEALDAGATYTIARSGSRA
ncbi:RNA-binding protein [Marinicauda salina]|uniref:RNA-binding protein n=1 Tax=Marinicauda salina TaxID=2135793 RepID=A0A2U2BXK3_9PROT|nr:FG-GAP-like repeat-containing protein [Marinicauda salina]PWE18727.1 RNA-binding protein [Marinicauda salina]